MNLLRLSLSIFCAATGVPESARVAHRAGVGRGHIATVGLFAVWVA